MLPVTAVFMQKFSSLIDGAIEQIDIFVGIRGQYFGANVIVNGTRNGSQLIVSLQNVQKLGKKINFMSEFAKS